MVELVLAFALASTPPAAPAAPKSPEVASPTAPKVEAPKPVEAHKTAEAAKSDAGVAEPLAAEGKPTAAPPVVEAQPIVPMDSATPPPLTRKALCGELTKTNKELAAARAKLEADRKSLENERKELEKLKAEIATARAGLRVETDKLEALLERRGELPAPGAAGERASATKASPVKPQELEGLARTLKSMKPEAAAALVQRVEPQLAAQLLKRMKPADAGAVMDRLKPELAADLMSLMSSMSSAPGATKAGGRL